MKWLRRIIYSIAGLVLLLGVIVAVWVGIWMPTSLPQTTGTITLAGLKAPVEIIRDPDAIVTIRAQTEADAAFALGYAHAQDRLVQMEFMRRLVAGRLSEVLGSMTLSADRNMRVLGLYRAAEQSEAVLPAEVRARLEAYAAGVNAYIEGHTGSWPLEFEVLFHRPEPWRVADSLAWGRIMALRLSSNFWQELLRYRLSKVLTPEELASLMPQGASAQTASLPPAAAPQGSLLASLGPTLAPSADASNSFVIASSRTTTGAPILANDPHLGLETPIVWYLVRIETPGKVLVGATSPGGPLVIIGHNGHVAWTLTTTHSDTQDLFIEKIDPADPTLYATPDGSSAFEARTETIRVRGGQDERITIRSSRHGPILSDLGRYEWVDDGHAIALSWPGLLPDDRTPIALHRLNAADNLDDAFAALRDFHSPQQNFLLADTAGNIGFIAAGRVPIRKSLSSNSVMPAPGWSGAYDWTGFIPFEELPQAINPPEGFIATANSKITPEGYRHFITALWPDGHRQDRLRELLRGSWKPTLDDAAGFMRDTYSAAAREQLALLMRDPAPIIKAADKQNLAREILMKWDFRVERDKSAPLILTTWLRETAKRMFAERLGPQYAEYIGVVSSAAIEAIRRNDPLWCHDKPAGDKGLCREILRQSLADATNQIADRYGDDVTAWRWGDAHRARFANPLLNRVPLLGDWLFEPLETDGDDYTLNRGTPYIDYDADEPVFPHVHGASMRVIFDFSNLDNSRFMIAGGQSGNPFSVHYRDLLVRWRDHQYVTMVGQGNDVLTLQPAR